MADQSTRLVKSLIATSAGRIALYHEEAALASTRPLVLFIHGALRSAATLLEWHQVLSPKYDVMYADLPGHAASPAEGAFTIQSIADRFRQVIKGSLAQRRVVVIGESIGGVVAAALGDGSVPQVCGVIAADPPLATAKQWPVQMSFSPLLAKAPEAAFIHQFAADVFGIMAGGRIEERTYYDHVRSLSVPALILTGDVPLWPRESKADVPCLLDDADLHIIGSFGNRHIAVEKIKDRGHLLLFKASEDCRARITQFCERALVDEAKRSAPTVSQASAKPAKAQVVEALAEGLRPRALAMARQYWDAEPSASTARYVVGLLDKLYDPTRISSHRVAFLRSFTVEPIVPMLQAEAALDGCRIEPWVGDFNAYGQDILNPGSGLYAFQPDTIVFSILLRDLSSALWETFADLAEGDVGDEIARVTTELTSLLTTLRQRTSAHILVSGFEQPVDQALGILDARRSLGQSAAIAQLNTKIRQFVAKETGMAFLDYEDLQSRFGRVAWSDDKKWQTARLPLSVDAMPRLARAWWRSIAPVARPQAKVLVLDLDNTLWGGTVGEDGVDGLKIRNDHAGAPFHRLQRAVLDLARRGVLIAIASKNNETDAFEVFDKHPDMLVKREHISAYHINWKSKAENIVEIAQELNLGLDSFVFFDDNPAERDVVRRGCPDVHVVELPKNAEGYADCLRQIASFERLRVLDEDRERGRYYREERERRDLLASAVSLDDYLAGLGVRLVVEPMSAATLERCAQLTQKTNQLNMTTRRYTEAELSKLATEPGIDVIAVHAWDRFGANGLVGVAIVRRHELDCEIDTFLLSCRVIGRGVEKALAAHIAQAARQNGATTLSGWFLPTSKNAPAADIYKSCNFTLVETTAAGAQRWQLDLLNTAVDVPSWISMQSPALAAVA